METLLNAKRKEGLRYILSAKHYLKGKDSADIAEVFDSFYNSNNMNKILSVKSEIYQKRLLIAVQ